MLFQITAPEHDKQFLNRLIFGLGIMKFLLATERKRDVVSSDIFLIWNKSIKYEGAILLAILYIIFALFKNTLSSKESILRWLRASSICVYSLPRIILQALRCILVTFSMLKFVEFPIWHCDSLYVVWYRHYKITICPLLIKMILFVIEAISEIIFSSRYIGNDHSKVSFHQCVLLKPFDYFSVLNKRL